MLYLVATSIEVLEFDRNSMRAMESWKFKTFIVILFLCPMCVLKHGLSVE